MNIDQLNHLSVEQARAELLRCCGSSRWASQMAARRPFTGVPDFLGAAEDIWNGLSSRDWMEAFSHHPRIGDLDSLRAKFAQTGNWAAGEQSGVKGAPDEILKALAEGNRNYEQKFGFIFIVCATGKNAGEMLAMLNERLVNDLAIELKVASAEQNKITRLRLQKLLNE
jgi:2-oxo-4-hydroxy-4-carboxy-5-ureidoimidazoline decarboxylase